MRVDLWADYICPWCYLALDTAQWLEREQGCRVVWHPFELHPEFPVGGIAIDRPEPKGPSRGRGRFAALAAEVGLPYERPPLAVNSHAALEISRLATAEGVFDEWNRRAFEAFFYRELDISDEAVLRAVGEESGIDPDDVSDALASGRYASAVDASKEAALEHGIGGTPGFLFDGRLAVPGWQDKKVWIRILDRLRSAKGR